MVKSEFLELRKDFYNLAFYGFYLKPHERYLSSVDFKRIEYTIEQSIQFQLGDFEMIQDYEEESEHLSARNIEKKEWSIKVQKEFRNERNKKNFFRVFLIFCIQMLLLWFMVVNISTDDEEKVTTGEY